MQQETEVAGSVFAQQRQDRTQRDDVLRLQRIRAERAVIVSRLGARAEFPPAPGSLLMDR